MFDSDAVWIPARIALLERRAREKDAYNKIVIFVNGQHKAKPRMTVEEYVAQTAQLELKL